MLSNSVARETDQRVGIFVDVQNMFYSARTLRQSKVDYTKLLQELLGNRQLVRAIAYVVHKPEVDQEAFLEALRRAGYEIKIRELTLRDDGTARGDWDVGITIDAMTLAQKLDTIILVTGDGDFVPLADALKGYGCRVEIVSFEQSTSNDLIRSCHDFVPIADKVLFKEEKFVDENDDEGASMNEEDYDGMESAFGYFGDEE
ncbi:MAG: NYN domain-containing protein [Planctomycetota bacterium]